MTQKVYLNKKITKLIFLCFLFCASFTATSQKTIDPIESLDLKDLSLQDCYFLDSCLTFASKPISDKKKINYYSSLTDAYYSFDLHLLALANIDILIPLLEKTSQQTKLADLYTRKSLIHDILGQYPKALTASQEGLNLYISSGDKDGQANSYNDIGVLHYYNDNLDLSQEYLNKALLIYQEIQDTSGMISYYINMANTLYEQSKFQKSIELYQSANNLSVILKDLEGQSIALSNIGEVYIELKEYNKAEKILLEALVLAEEMDDPWTISNPLRGLGQLYLLTDELHKAIRVLKQSVKLSVRTNSMAELSEAYELLYQLHKTQKDYKSAMEYLEMFKETNDSLFDQSKERMIGEMEMEYQMEDKAREIKLLNQKKQLDDLEHQKKIDQQKNQMVYLTIGLIGFAVIIFFSIRGILQKKKANIKLREQNLIINEKNLEINLAYDQIEAKSTEITDSIKYAKRIQAAILPSKQSISALLPNSFILYKPKDVVAGDFYWLEQKDGQTLIAAADCTGHGVPGAMVSVVCNNALNRSVREHGLTTPGLILDKTREIILQEFSKSEEKVNDGMDIALCSINAGQINFAGAHNPLWIVRSGSSIIEEIKGTKQPIGSFDKPTPFTTHSTPMNPGDTLYMFTDGYPDQFGGETLPNGKVGGKKMKTGNFKKLILSIQNMSMSEQQNYLDEALLKWKGDLEQLDDICIIGIKF